ncbi:Homoserine dehydrogenase [Penicillium chermesinum]|uniref:Molybdopterin synthase sulfur carrier subunit n=1 Tax=Penicillium chermesinum TaxID=63820 RepID=A0A9W9TJC2_9EURO|nr:Homoserine dehydrogenase [Penicillium chermesinum]KAJ5224972.1 Homoserine dehydrogenase [Penicillium chermesinum]
MAKQIYIGIVGVGEVGNALLSQLGQIPNPQPKVILLSRSSQALLTLPPSYEPSIPLTNWEDAAATPSITKTAALTPQEIANHLISAPGPAILVDNTSSLTLSQSYPFFLKQGISIVTPNKKGFSYDISLFNDIFASAAEGNALVYHTATVGGSLPVLPTLRNLIANGDEIIRIEGVLSGTLSLLFDEYVPASGTSDQTWSSLVNHALKIGFMEPDPRDDLNGMDFARKLSILARVAGLHIAGPETFPVQSLIPDELSQMAAAKEEAVRQDKVLRYIGSIDFTSQKIKVGLEHIEKDDPIAKLNGSQIVSIYTKRDPVNPVILKGGGGGGEITARCVMSDLLQWLSMRMLVIDPASGPPRKISLNAHPPPLQLTIKMASQDSSSFQGSTGAFTIHYFATASQYTNKNTERLPAPLPLSRLYPLLEERYPGITTKVLGTCSLSLEGDYVDVEEDAERVIQAGEEVAVIPPVSSG